jgi:hypothetical protein
LEIQIGPGDTHRFGYVRINVRASKGKCITKCTIGAIPINRRSLGNLRFAFRKVEIESR